MKACFHFLWAVQMMLKNHMTLRSCEAKKAQQNLNTKAWANVYGSVEMECFQVDTDYLVNNSLGFGDSTSVLSLTSLANECKQQGCSSFQITRCNIDTLRNFIGGLLPNISISTSTDFLHEYAALNPCFNVNGVDFLIESISTDLEFFDDSFASKSKSYLKESLEEKETMYPVLSRIAMDIISVQASSVASESIFSTSGRVLSIRRTRLTPASLEMCMCLKDHLNAKERKQDKSPLEIPLDFEEDVLDDEVQRNEAIPLSDEEIALDASSEGTLSPGGPGYDYMMSSEEVVDDY
ncbi:zinc finger BED domain-containing protein RICESLEEPER 3 [Tanacetum coccineum]